MGSFIFGIVFLIIGIVVYVALSKQKVMKPKTVYNPSKGQYEAKGTPKELNPVVRYAVLAISLIIAVVLLVSSVITTVPTGHTGIITVFGSVKSATLDSGMHFIAPWENVIKMDNRVQKQTLSLSCFSSDIQEVRVMYTLNYQINKQNASQIYKTIGTDYYAITIEPAIAESVKIVMARYTAEELVGTREALAEIIETILSSQLEKFNIEVVSTAIEDMDFTDSFTNAVEAKQVADQKAKQAKIEQEQAKMEASYNKEISEIQASAAAEVAKIQAQADMEVAKIGADSAEYQGKKEASIALQRLASINGWTVVTNEETGINELYKADGNKVTAEELSIGAKNLIQYYYTQQWDGVLPQTYLGEDAVSTVVIP